MRCYSFLKILCKIALGIMFCLSYAQAAPEISEQDDNTIKDLFYEGRYPEVLKLLESKNATQTLEKANPQFYVRLLAQAGEFDKAISVCEKRLATKPALNLSQLNEMNAAFDSNERKQEAFLLLIKQYAPEHYDSLRARTALGKTARQLLDSEKSLKVRSQVLSNMVPLVAINKHEGITKLREAGVLLLVVGGNEKDNYALAKSCFGVIATVEPTFMSSPENKAQYTHILVANGDYSEAKAYIESIQNAFPKFFAQNEGSLRIDLSQCLRGLGDITNAVKQCDIIISNRGETAFADFLGNARDLRSELIIRPTTWSGSDSNMRNPYNTKRFFVILTITLTTLVPVLVLFRNWYHRDKLTK